MHSPEVAPDDMIYDNFNCNRPSNDILKRDTCDFITGNIDVSLQQAHIINTNRKDPALARRIVGIALRTSGMLLMASSVGKLCHKLGDSLRHNCRLYIGAF
jgi:hypothetical protein